MSDSTLLDAALQYAGGGKPVFPCNEDKAPFTHHGFRDATCNVDQIRAWWTKSPDALIGMPTGEVSGLVVLDIDVKNGHCGDDSLYALQEVHDKLPDTVEVLTTTGGRHLYFCYPGVRVKSTSSELGDGLDVRGDGGYVIVPPSRINGKAYEWEASSPPKAADMPGWLVDLVRADRKDHREQQPRSKGTIPEGQRNTWLTAQAGRFRRIGSSSNDIEG